MRPQVAADPIGCHRRLGVFTTFANLLDLCAITLPAAVTDSGCFGVSLLAPAFHDGALIDLARALAPAASGSTAA